MGFGDLRRSWPRRRRASQAGGLPRSTKRWRAGGLLEQPAQIGDDERPSELEHVRVNFALGGARGENPSVWVGHQQCASHWVGHPEKSVALGGARGKCRRFGWGLFCRAGRIGWGTHWGRFGWGMAKRGMLWVGPSRYPPRVPSADPKSASTLYNRVPSHSTTISLRMPFLSISPQTVSLREPELCCCSFFSHIAALRDVTTVLLFFLSAGALAARRDDYSR